MNTSSYPRVEKVPLPRISLSTYFMLQPEDDSMLEKRNVDVVNEIK
jgi:hypothetical protein